jgi:hypothetical protein
MKFTIVLALVAVFAVQFVSAGHPIVAQLPKGLPFRNLDKRSEHPQGFGHSEIDPAEPNHQGSPSDAQEAQN